MKRENRIILYLLSGIYVFFTLLRIILFPDKAFGWHIETSLLGLAMMITSTLMVLLIDSLMDRLYPYERNIPGRMMLQLIISLVIIFLIRHYFYIPYRRTLPGPPSKELNITLTIIHSLSVVTFILAIYSYRFFNRWRETELKKEILEKEKATVQYDNLKNQLNPHFLFNSLTSLNSLIFENPQLASEFLQQLSKVYRYVLENNDKTLVSLATEVKFISNYIKLLGARFGAGLMVNVGLSAGVGEKKILPVTLQILIENAIKHNIVSKDHPLQIDIYDEADYLVVRNNLQIKHTMEDSNKQGLENLKNLYNILVEKEMVIDQSQTHFLVKIPLI